MKKPKPIIRLQRAYRLPHAGRGRPRLLVIDPERIDGVVVDPAADRTQVVMLDGSAVYVMEDPHEIIAECERLGVPVGMFDKQGAKEARRDCLE